MQKGKQTDDDDFAAFANFASDDPIGESTGPLSDRLRGGASPDVGVRGGVGGDLDLGKPKNSSPEQPVIRESDVGQEMTPMQCVIWTKNAKPMEQLLMMRIIDAYGVEEFCVTLDEFAAVVGLKKGVLIRALRGVKELEWLDSKRDYKKGLGNLPLVFNCRYRVTL